MKLYHERNFVGAQQLTAHYKFKILAASWAILSENLVVLGYWVPVKLYPCLHVDYINTIPPPTKMYKFRQLKQLYALCNNTHLMLDGGAVGYYFER